MRYVLSLVLLPLSLIYGIIAYIRNFLYDSHILKPVSVEPQVISIGNLSLGGTGKTPICISLARSFTDEGKKVALICRGYRGSAKSIRKVETGDKPSLVGDEAIELRERSGVDVFIGPSKSQTAQYVGDIGTYDILLVDDGFQHRRLKRDLDILVLDASCEKLDYLPFPSGRARESLSSICRADVLFITRHSSKSSYFSQIESRLYSDEKPVFQVDFSVENSGQVMKQLQGKKLLAVSAIGNPDSFDVLLRQRLGLNVVSHIKYRDHYAYTKDDVALFQSFIDKGDAEAVVTTNKDAVKLRRLGFDHFLPISIVADLPKTSDFLGR